MARTLGLGPGSEVKPGWGRSPRDRHPELGHQPPDAAPAPVADGPHRLDTPAGGVLERPLQVARTAVQDEVWVTAPGGEPWEVHTVSADARPDLEGAAAACC
jgi:hypothetical protein